ncbi:MAG: 50S ribosomal protein L16 [Nanoarchaeota archaeon]|nr:50S ribosomal protein L16 [Nanoarchaeota archaeon]MBU1270345.1 50S ribosomal protein L16 [Nanoarchaeota archaeon]MBU1604660.1 50S ribosomal protein L16 [Nanoarchaeota archaeon]MBU2443137.1 50S ribosomal protein L16 [Nanoarchaeota archaeon]
MAKLRKGVAYRRIERPYTRKSKYRTQQFVRATPHNKIVKFDMGDLKRTFQYAVSLKVNCGIQLRHNALESARMTSNRLLETKCGKTGYRLKLLVYPHHILRENPLASGAGADRMSTGMKKSFGKPIGLAAQVRKNQKIFSAYVDEPFLEFAKQAMNRAKHKVPCGCKIEIVKLR